MDFGVDVTNGDCPDAVQLYRRILATCEEKIEIMEIGYLQVIAALLRSQPDGISPKSGMELVQEKVSKIWVMAGKWDADGEKENNFCRNPRSRMAGEAFCRLCPVPVTFLGWEVGYGVITGNHLDHSDHLYHTLADHGSENGRHSWDPMLVLLAMIGDEEEAGYKTVRGTAYVDRETGRNYFKEDENGPHKYVIPLFGASYYEEIINERIN
jgi:inosine-uridine nucleoside N-ribohydrolase